MQAMHLKCGLGLKTWEPIKIETQRRGACIFVFFCQDQSGAYNLEQPRLRSTSPLLFHQSFFFFYLFAVQSDISLYHFLKLAPRIM